MRSRSTCATARRPLGYRWSQVAGFGLVLGGRVTGGLCGPSLGRSAIRKPLQHNNNPIHHNYYPIQYV
jgi:hypothetical protein